MMAESESTSTSDRQVKFDIGLPRSVVYFGMCTGNFVRMQCSALCRVNLLDFLST